MNTMTNPAASNLTALLAALRCDAAMTPDAWRSLATQLSAAAADCAQRAGATVPSFETAFSAAFDAAPGARDNYVLLADLRAALSQYDRAAFDAGLRALRVTKVYGLDTPDGRHVRLTPEQNAAGIQECGSNFVYCARRS